MPSWYALMLMFFLFCSCVSVISFRRITARKINKRVQELGEYYLSTEDTVGYTLLSVALAVVLPIKWARIAVPKLIIDADSVKRLDLTTTDRVLGFSFIISLMTFTIVAVYAGAAF